MRISSLQIYNIANSGLANANEALVKTQEQLSTGQRVITPSDDPVAATKIMQLSEEIAGITQYQKNIDIATNNLVLEESILASVNNLVQRMQEIAVQAGNTASLSENDYLALASEVDSRVDELQQLLNTQNANGDYIFGGYKSTSAPFTGSIMTGFDYNGDQGEQFIKIANNTTIKASDSGKAAFVDVESRDNTIATYPSRSNQSDPPAFISVGQISDQLVFDEFYPEDIVITFNADEAISPTGKNFTATERSTGQVIAANQAYVSGDEITIHGASFRITGNPNSGTAATPATLTYGSGSPVAFPFDFTAPANESFTIVVDGRQESFVLDANIASTTDISTVLNSAANGNAAKLANLGISVDDTGFHMPSGVNFSVRDGSNNINTVLGFDTLNGVGTANGELAQAGDRMFIDSTRKQDILTTLSRFSQAMKNFDGTSDSRNALEDTVASTLDNLSHAQTSVLDIMSSIGARFNTLESTKELHVDSNLVIQEVLSKLRDVDYAEAATRLQAQSLILQAAQSAFIRVSQLSLFNQL